MNIADDLGLGQGQNVAVIEQIFLIFGEPLTTGIRLFETIAANRRSHGAVEHENALAKFRSKFCGQVGGHGLL